MNQEEETKKDSTRTSASVSQLQELLKALRVFTKGLIEVPKLLVTPDASVEAISKKLAYMLATTDRFPISTLVPIAYEELVEFQGRLDELKKERSDIRKRREEFVSLAKENGWSVISTGTRDHIGPYVVAHTDSGSTVFFGKMRILKVGYPSGVLLLNALQKRNHLLSAGALKDWDFFMEAVVKAQERISSSEPVPIEDIYSSIEPNEKKRRRLQLIFCYRIALLISGKAPGGWRLMSAPPALSEQAHAWTIPRLDRTNDIVRLRRFRVSR
jgi:hypothetical protein